MNCTALFQASASSALVEGIDHHDSSRHQSYLDLNSYLNNKSFDTEEERGNSGNADRKAKNEEIYLFREDQLMKGVMPLSVHFLKRQESFVSNFIEFIIRARYQEGPKSN